MTFFFLFLDENVRCGYSLEAPEALLKCEICAKMDLLLTIWHKAVFFWHHSIIRWPVPSKNISYDQQQDHTSEQLLKSKSDRLQPDMIPVGLIAVRYRFKQNASWDVSRDIHAVWSGSWFSLQIHAYSNILRILPPKKNENYQMKNSDIFHIPAQNIDCGYSLEPPRRGGSNEYPQCFWA